MVRGSGYTSSLHTFWFSLKWGILLLENIRAFHSVSLKCQRQIAMLFSEPQNSSRGHHKDEARVLCMKESFWCWVWNLSMSICCMGYSSFFFFLSLRGEMKSFHHKLFLSFVILKSRGRHCDGRLKWICFSGCELV
jgi:hypothetical protein